MRLDFYHKPIPRIDTQQMIEVDRLMIEEYGVKLIQMMENAGRGLARLGRDRFLGGYPVGKKVLVLTGTGGNGGGALVAARRLKSWGADVSVVISKEKERFTPIPLHQLEIVERMGIDIQMNVPPAQVSPDLILDGLIGYSIKGNPHGLTGKLIHWTREQKAPVISLDTPSGLDLTTGKPATPCVRADACLTLALPKQGLFSKEALPFVGELYLADISIPPALYAEPSLGLSVSPELFAKDDIIRIPLA